MITKCANPLCSQPFRVFRGGKLFTVDVGSNTKLSDSSTTERVPRKLEHFWLCKHCASTMTLVVQPGKSPTVVSIGKELQFTGELSLPSHGASQVKGTL